MIGLGVSIIHNKADSLIILNVSYTNTQVVIKFILPSDKNIIINWGDGTSEVVDGQDETLITKTSNYATPENYICSMAGDWGNITYIDISRQEFVNDNLKTEFSSIGKSVYPFVYTDNCDSLLGGLWQLNNNSGNATIEVDSVDFVQGVGSIKANLQRGDKLKRMFSPAVDLTDDIIIKIKISTFTNQVLFRIIFWDGADYFMVSQLMADPHILREDEWFTWHINKLLITTVSGSPSWSNISQIQFIPIMDIAFPLQTIDLNVDDIRSYEKPDAATFTFRFDDSLDEHYDAAELLLTYGYAAVSAVMTDEVGAAGRLTLAEMEQMRDWGWDISSHWLNNTDLTSIDISVAEAGILEAYNYLVNNDFINGARFFIYPQGAFNDAVEAVVKEYHVMTAVSANSTAYRYLSDFNEFRLGYYTPTDISNAQDLIDDAITHKYHIIFGFHALADLDLITAICDYLQANNIEVMTYSKIYDQYYLKRVKIVED